MSMPAEQGPSLPPTLSPSPTFAVLARMPFARLVAHLLLHSRQGLGRDPWDGRVPVQRAWLPTPAEGAARPHGLLIGFR